MKELEDKKIWIDEPEDHDFPAALDYLELLFHPQKAKELVKSLKSAETIRKRLKIF